MFRETLCLQSIMLTTSFCSRRTDSLASDIELQSRSSIDQATRRGHMAWPVRYKLVGLLASGSAINYADRVNISVAAPRMTASVGWDEAAFGIILCTVLSRYC